MRHRPIAQALCLVLSLWGSSHATTAVAAGKPAAVSATANSQKLQHFFDTQWERQMQRAPEWATFSGDHRFDDRLSDRSPEAIAAQRAERRQALKTLLAIPQKGLSEVEQVSRELYRRQLERDIALDAFEGAGTLSIGTLWGFQSDLSRLMRASPSATEQDLRNILARYAAYPKRVDQEIARWQLGMQLGWVTARPVLERALDQLDKQLSPELSRSPMFEPFTRIGKDVPEAQREALKAQALAALQGQVVPAMQKLGRFLREQYLPLAPVDGAFSRYPQGKAVYAMMARLHTTTDLTPEQIHELGLSQVERLRKEMEAIKTEVGFKGTMAEFHHELNTNPIHFHADGEALLAGYREIAKRIDPELPKLFAELPRAPYGIRAMPAYMGPGAAETYNGPDRDNRRPGWFNANPLAYKTRPKWSMETLVAHETVPGHHLQNARANELGDLPRFRRGAYYTAYGEGWALYAETLGAELGLYQDPYSRFGHLQAQVFRAARLVVDTGIHALGWQRQQAIDYMVKESGQSEIFVSAEVDRYTSMPGQALAYMVGQLKIAELRARAKAALGERFDVRRFHMVILDQGPLPLDLLEQRVDAWIAAQRKS